MNLSISRSIESKSQRKIAGYLYNCNNKYYDLNENFSKLSPNYDIKMKKLNKISNELIFNSKLKFLLYFEIIKSR